jgi:hypothetical protein
MHIRCLLSLSLFENKKFAENIIEYEYDKLHDEFAEPVIDIHVLVHHRHAADLDDQRGKTRAEEFYEFTEPLAQPLRLRPEYEPRIRKVGEDNRQQNGNNIRHRIRHLRNEMPHEIVASQIDQRRQPAVETIAENPVVITFEK